MFYPARVMDPRIHSRGYKRKRQPGETFGLCDARCATSHHQVELGQHIGHGSGSSEHSSPSSVPEYASEIAKVSTINTYLQQPQLTLQRFQDHRSLRRIAVASSWPSQYGTHFVSRRTTPIVKNASPQNPKRSGSARPDRSRIARRRSRD
jgi:hypothetical protein